MLVWRICKQKRVADALSGIGAEQHGGRWNHKGDWMVYTSTSLSLATLELFVHLQPNELPDDLYSVMATIPDVASSEELTIADLPKNWRDYPAPASLQDIGSKWLREMRSFVLVVPSAVNPHETNVLLNPLHREAATISDIQWQPFYFDSRMWKQK
ncbi:MAG TPA: RES family NAD+ phosphorylase [Lacipirellulaceae bacterium]|jgi:RES domain-containing protein